MLIEKALKLVADVLERDLTGIDPSFPPLPEPPLSARGGE